MMDVFIGREKKIESFSRLGEWIKQSLGGNGQPEPGLKTLLSDSHIYNGWFTEENVREALLGIASLLSRQALEKWLQNYKLDTEKGLNIAVIMAGNIPAVGFHDFLCVLMSGNRFTGKLSSGDDRILPFLASVLVEIDPVWKNRIFFTNDKLENFNAVIATGSNNTSRYFEYYFGKFPHIFRRNRNAVAILTGKETETDIAGLGRDIFQYFGLGCRNVAKVFIPEGYDFEFFFRSLYPFHNMIYHNKYANNYEYNRTLYLMNKVKVFDNNFLLLKEDTGLSSPVAVLFYEYYNNEDQLKERLLMDKDAIQCIVSGREIIANAVPFGQSQRPQPTDYADNVDTMKFLLEIAG